MKKTIYSFFAMAAIGLSSASAVTLSDSIVGEITAASGSTTTYDFSELETTYAVASGAYVTLTLDASVLKDYIGSGTTAASTIPTLFYLSSSADQTAGATVGTGTNSNNGIWMTQTAASGTTINTNSCWSLTGASSSDLTISRMGTMDMSGIDKAALTYSFQRSGNNSYVYAWLTLYNSATGAVSTHYGQRSPGGYTGLSEGNLSELSFNNELVTSAYVFSGSLTDTGEATAISLNKEALGIPEPTTATLSLLALAGLAARRRRR